MTYLIILAMDLLLAAQLPVLQVSEVSQLYHFNFYIVFVFSSIGFMMFVDENQGPGGQPYNLPPRPGPRY